ncbi:MAG: exodeoxyribonuclease VII small subunit [Atopobiaceae bacterium]|jgi:exodeoxyribonuclease VII small subunit|nr:exodeoxyribonuclease VII small subunit [Atopobiaceae bacterium]
MSEETKADRPIDELSFKEASIELEQVVRSLEAGDLELEESLDRYQRGVELLKSLRERLANAEQKVQVLLDASKPDAEVPDTTAAPTTRFLED